ncbi:conserved hypothetical protein [metagenome]|uniref:Uncharacterized protein n=1 Tax=metagenome TaxID=256318 RepID=A0A2P2C7J6_9ZZZZ
MTEPTPEHQRPDGVTDATVEAVGMLTKALEATEAARGHLIQFHRLTGTGDAQLRDAVALLRDAGHDELADSLDQELVGRNVLEGRWTFQIVEEYDDDYFATFKAAEKQVRDALVMGRRHLREAEMKEANRTRGKPSHTAAPPSPDRPTSSA